MGFSRSCLGRLCLLVSLVSSVTFAAPVAVLDSDRELSEQMENLTMTSDYVELVTRGTPGNTKNNPTQATFDISTWPNIAETNCYIMLCVLGGKRTFQRVLTEDEAEENYKASGASLKPFAAPQLNRRHTQQITLKTTSAEDFPWRSIALGPNEHRYVVPTVKSENDRQGAGIKNGYAQSNPQVAYTDWFTINFTPRTSFGKYCKALFSKPPNFSICKKKNKENLYGEEIDISDYIYEVNKNVKPPFPFYHIKPGGSGSGS